MKKTMIFITAVLFLAPVTTFADVADGFGLSSFPVMMAPGVNARSLALADSTAALCGDIGGVNANPAALAKLDRMTLNASTMTWLFDSSYQAAAFAMPLPFGEGKYGVAALSGRMFTMGGVETVLDGSSLGTNGSGDFSAGVVWADNMLLPFKQSLAEAVHLNIGLGVKYVQSELLGYTASALSFDFGAVYSLYLPNATSLWNVVKDVVTNAFARKFTVTTNVLSIETVSTNLVSNKTAVAETVTTNSRSFNEIVTNWTTNQIKTNAKPKRDDTFSIALGFRDLSGTLWSYRDGDVLRTPWNFDLAALYTIYRDARHDLFMTLQLTQPSDSGPILAAGAEYSYKRTIFLRGGYKIVGRENDGFTFGVGLNFEVMDKLAVQADYAHLLKNDLAGSDTFSMSLFF